MTICHRPDSHFDFPLVTDGERRVWLWGGAFRVRHDAPARRPPV